jgi:hypothetical protein
MFNLNEVKESTGNGSLYIYPGVREVVIKGWAKGESPSGTPFIEVELVTKDAFDAGTENASKKFQFYMSEKAKDQSMVKVKHILTKVTKEANIKPATTADEFVAMLNALSRNKSLRMKFTGEEYEYNGEVKEAARIGLPTFAEANQVGAKYEPVAEANTKLVYDKNDKYDFKPLTKTATAESEVATPATNW